MYLIVSINLDFFFRANLKEFIFSAFLMTLSRLFQVTGPLKIRIVAANEHQDLMKSQENRDRRKYQPNQGILYRDIALIGKLNETYL